MAKVLIPLATHSTFRECDEAEQHLPRVNNTFIRPFMVTLIEALSRKRPTWQFVTHQYGVNTNLGYRVEKFAIMDQGEVLGTVDYAWHGRNGDCYEIDNPRMRKKRQRGANTRTNNLAKAVKLILDNFYGLTLPERMIAAQNKTSQVISGTWSSATYDARNSFDWLREDVLDYLKANWESFSAWPLSKPNLDKRRADLPAQLERAKDTKGVNDAYSNGAGTMVVVRGTNYHTQRKTGDEVITFTAEMVPPHIRMGIGMLKLIDVNGYIPGIGTRTEDNTYYVMDNTGDQND